MAAPNTTLYVKNLNDQVKTEELRTQLFALFMTYGRVIDIVAQKGTTKRGQAFLVFSDITEATTAMRACEGMYFYDKPMHIEYARTKSYAISRREDPEFVPPNPVNPGTTNLKSSAALEKRVRDGDDVVDGRQPKREKVDDDDDEMEMDDEDESGQKKAAKSADVVPQIVQQPSQRLLCTNLPQEVTDDMLSVLFQQYQGFQSTHIAQAPTPAASGAKAKMAQVFFDTPDLASVAKEALDGFTLKKGWKMTVAYI